MKGKSNTKRRILLYSVVLGVTAISLTLREFFAYGKPVSYLCPGISVVFIIGLILWAVYESAREPFHNTNIQKEKKVNERTSDFNRDSCNSPLRIPQEIIDSSLCNNKKEIQDTEEETGETYLSQSTKFSYENLLEIYDYSNNINAKKRKEMLDEFQEYRKNLDLTEKAKNEVRNLRKNTNLLYISGNARAEFLLYDKKYLVPTLTTYLDWYDKRYDEIKEALQDRMFNYIFSYIPPNTDKNMYIIRLEPAIVTESGDGEYFIEEKNKGALYFGS